MSLSDTSFGFPGEPDTLDEEEKMASLESVALDLQMVLDDMGTYQGVSQKIIRPAMHLMPGNVKLASFTQNPTHTNYQIAMEGVSAGMGALIAAAVAAAALLMVKIISWLISLFRSNDKATKQAGKSAEQLNETMKSNAEISRLLTPEMKRTLEEVKELKVGPIYAEMAKLWNPILEDTMRAGAISRTVGAAGTTFADIVKKMKMTMELIEREGRKDNGTDHMVAAEVLARLNDVEMHDDSPAIRNLFIPILRCTAEPINFGDDMREIADHLGSMMEKHLGAGFNGSKVVDDLGGYKIKSCPLLKIDAVKNLEELEKEVKRLEGVNFNPKVGEDVDKALRRGVQSLRRMMQAVKLFYSISQKMVRERNHMIDLVNCAASATNRALVNTIVSSDDSDAKNKLREHNKKK